MKQQTNFAQISHTVILSGLILLACSAFVGAQTVIPTVCFEAKPETFTRTLTNNVSNASNTMYLNEPASQGLYALVINPGGATEERLVYGGSSGSSTIFISGNALPVQSYQFPHAAGETILLIAEGDAVWGYNNTSNAVVNIPRGVSSHNYFAPGNLVYASQPSIFQPGVNENVFRLKVLAAFPVTWFLNNGQATSNATQGCGTITYQGRLSDQNAAANGQYDLQFQAFDAETGGTSQSGLITIENVQVTNGVFTVPLKFGSTLFNNFKARFLEIGVRPGAATGNDPFTVLTPRQPITSVPYAVNAQNALNATNATNVTGKGIVQLPLVSAPPPNTLEGGCGNSTNLGNLKVDATNNRLYVCTATGWKSTVLQ